MRANRSAKVKKNTIVFPPPLMDLDWLKPFDAAKHKGHMCSPVDPQLEVGNPMKKTSFALKSLFSFIFHNSFEADGFCVNAFLD
jgi:hypothetical protein